MPAQIGIASLFAVIPALAGMVGGQTVRRLLPETAFRRLLFVAIVVLGCYIVLRAVS